MSFHKTCFEQNNPELEWKVFVEEITNFDLAKLSKIGNRNELIKWIKGYVGNDIELARENIRDETWTFKKIGRSYYFKGT